MKTGTVSAAILVASDNRSDAEAITKLFEDEFEKILTTTDADAAAQDFDRHRPDILVLGFNTLEKAERYYLGLYRCCTMVQQHPHRTIILCNKDEVRRVYELCKKNYFDDYVLFWPMTYDMSRLAMTVHHALRELADLRTGGPTALGFAAQARRMAELENLLDMRLAEGSRRATVANRAIAQAERDIGIALDGFSQHLIGGALPHAVTIQDPDALCHEIDRLKREQVAAPLSAAAASAGPLKTWADDLRKDCAPYLEASRALGALAGRVRATVLVVDDDELQRNIIGKILAAENYRLVFAGNGIEALNVMRKMRPDLVLMDVQMPELDGIEVMRRLKAAPEFANIPVVMITGRSERDVVRESLQAGASGFVVKPFERETLLAKVKQIL